MKEEKLKAIVLRSMPFKDRQVILTLFSEEKGIVNMIVKGLSKAKPNLIACINPLCEAEFLYSEGSSTLLKCKEASILNSHFELRQKYSFLELAIKLTQAIQKSQYPEKPSRELYLLFSSYLKKIPFFDDCLDKFYISFLLKVLKLEGLLQTSKKCSICDQISETYLYGSETFCNKHMPDGQSVTNFPCTKLIQNLADAKSFLEIKSISTHNLVATHIENYFYTSLES